MRYEHILVQPIDASDGNIFVIMDESTGAEIKLEGDARFVVPNMLHELIWNLRYPERCKHYLGRDCPGCQKACARMNTPIVREELEEDGL